MTYLLVFVGETRSGAPSYLRAQSVDGWRPTVSGVGAAEVELCKEADLRQCTLVGFYPLDDDEQRQGEEDMADRLAEAEKAGKSAYAASPRTMGPQLAVRLLFGPGFEVQEHR